MSGFFEHMIAREFFRKLFCSDEGQAENTTMLAEAINLHIKKTLVPEAAKELQALTNTSEDSTDTWEPYVLKECGMVYDSYAPEELIREMLIKQISGNPGISVKDNAMELSRTVRAYVYPNILRRIVDRLYPKLEAEYPAFLEAAKKTWYAEMERASRLEDSQRETVNKWLNGKETVGDTHDKRYSNV